MSALERRYRPPAPVPVTPEPARRTPRAVVLDVADVLLYQGVFWVLQIGATAFLGYATHILWGPDRLIDMGIGLAAILLTARALFLAGEDLFAKPDLGEDDDS